MKKSLKIVVLTEVINFHSGSRAPLEIARHLSLLGQDVHVYAYDFMFDEEAYQSLVADNLKVTIIKKPTMPFIGKYFVSIKLFLLLKSSRFDIITFSASPPSFLAAKLTMVPIIRIYMGTQFDAYLENKLPSQKPNFFEMLTNKITNIYIYVIEYITLYLSSEIVAISQYCAKDGESLYHKKISYVIYLGTTFFKPSSDRKSRKIINLISVSRITPYKGFHRIVESLNLLKLNNVKLTIVGSQPKPRYVKYLKKIGGKKLRVVINPSDNELAKYYQKSDIYVNADKYLFFGLPICEAGYIGIPSISFDYAAAREVIDHGKSGYVARNETEFAYYLEKLIDNEKLREKFGRNAKKIILEKFTWENTAKEYLELFKKMIHNA